MPFQIDGRGDMNAFVLTSPLAGVMLLTRRQPFYPSAAHDKFFSICTAFGGYTKFGIAPENHIMLVEQIQKIEIFLAMQQVRNRKIFLLYLSGIGVRSLAQIFGIATTTVYAILGKMRRSLKVFLHMEEKAQ